MTAVIDVYDAIGTNVSHLPAGQPAAGYPTGFGDVPWSTAELAAHPGVVWIDQSPVNTTFDETCDEIDYENSAATLADLPGWCFAAWRSYNAAIRPGQRKPAVYESSGNVTAVVNALIAGGIKSNVGLHIAKWGITRAAAIAMIQDTSGPFPIIAVQYDNGPYYDRNVYSQEWLSTVSGKVPDMKITGVPAQADFKDGSTVLMIGIGPQGQKLWEFVTTDGQTWTGVSL